METLNKIMENQTPKQISSKIKSFIKDKFDKYKANLKELSFILSTILIYGLLVNYMLFGIFGIPFRFFTFPAYGLAYYFIMEELQVIVKKIKQ